ncbi:ankyrin repeat protein [Penicillium hordei]|uniref:Ankyrin repeat protein n=1 Tax=Penicillium hordei TaxID=40994 RepID=A0AAD6GWW5_9EURO|nr:ankyrin repeat protein [Penicillium hordei]KAJ5592215.1 ankyrin repeat protein [Penicillium hordei]
MVETFSFPSVKFDLMVGGDPSKARLGDVVVSAPPVAPSPAVVQWDSGDGGASSQFRQTGSLDNQPLSPRTALTLLETEHEMNGSKIAEYLDRLGREWPMLAPKYLRSDLLLDVLFRPDHAHVNHRTG